MLPQRHYASVLSQPMFTRVPLRLLCTRLLRMTTVLWWPEQAWARQTHADKCSSVTWKHICMLFVCIDMFMQYLCICIHLYIKTCVLTHIQYMCICMYTSFLSTATMWYLFLATFCYTTDRFTIWEIVACFWYMHVCVYTYIHVCIYIHMYIRINIWT